MHQAFMLLVLLPCHGRSLRMHQSSRLVAPCPVRGRPALPRLHVCHCASAAAAPNGGDKGPADAGAEVVEVGIPDLHLCRVAHSATLGSDSLQDFKRRHGANLRRSLDMLGRDLQVGPPKSPFLAVKFCNCAVSAAAQRAAAAVQPEFPSPPLLTFHRSSCVNIDPVNRLADSPAQRQSMPSNVSYLL